jgi:tetratricopeptide (TPR) repeat protein
VIADHGKGNLDEAVQLAQGVVRRFPDEPGYADTLGWVYYKKGLYSPAVEQLQKAVAKASARGGDNALYRYHFGLALAGAGKKADARRELQTAQRLAGQEASRGKQFAQADDLRKALESL